MAESQTPPGDHVTEPAQRLWQLWEAGQQPELADFVDHVGPLSAAALLAVVRVDQRQRWLHDERVPVEAYLKTYPGLAADRENVVLLAYAEFLLLEELGEAPDPGEYQRRFPEYGEALQLQLRLHDALEASSIHQHTTLAFRGTMPTLASASTSLPAIPGYELLGVLGKGGMGVVYKARQTKLDRTVALKMIRSGKDVHEDMLARFRAEAGAVARLQHANIVQIYEVGEQDGQPFFALEYVGGGSLDSRVRGSPQPPREAAGFVEVLARAMHYAHQHGVIHRDLKPGNVLLEGLPEAGRKPADSATAPLSPSTPSPGLRIASLTPKIADFGLAKRLDASSNGEEAGRLTQTGALIGTPSYMAPEQARGQPEAVGPHTDVYALGAILYELLTGRPPFKAASTYDTIRLVLDTEPVPPRRLQPRVPRDLETICLKCLQKDPRRRFASALALADDLRRFLREEPIAARPVGAVERLLKWARRRPAVAALSALSSLAAVGFLAVTLLWYQGRLQSAEELTRAEADKTALERQRADEAEKATKQAEELRQQADLNRDQALREAERNRRGGYAAQLHRAVGMADWDPGRGLQVLLDPGQCPLDLRDFSWDYAYRLCRRDRLTIKAHAGWVSGLAVSPDGRTLFTSGQDANNAGEIKVWDLPEGRLRAAWQADPGMIFGIALAPGNSRLLASAGKNGASLWDADTGEEVWRSASGRNGPAAAILFASADKLVWVGGHVVHVVDVNHLEELRNFPSGVVVNSLAVDASGTRLATGHGSGGGVGDDFYEAKVWNLETGKPEVVFPAHDDIVTSVALSPDGRTLISGSRDSKFVVWDLDKKVARAQMEAGSVGRSRIVFAPDGQTFAVGVSRSVTIYTATADARISLPGPGDNLGALAFLPDGKGLVRGGTDGLVAVVSMPEPPNRRLVPQQPAGRQPPLFTPGFEMAALVQPGGAIVLWDTGARRESARVPAAGALERAQFSPDGRVLLTLHVQPDQPRRLTLWETRTGRQMTRLDFAFKNVGSMFSPNGQTLLTQAWNEDRKIEARLWDVNTGTQRGRLDTTSASVSQPVFNSDGRALATLAADRVVVWDCETGQVKATWKAAKQFVKAVDFLSGGERLLTQEFEGNQRLSRLWDVATTEEMATFHGSVKVSPDERWLVVWGGIPDELSVWKLTPQPVLHWKRSEPCQFPSFLPSGQLLAVRTPDLSFRFLELATGKELSHLPANVAGPMGLSFTPDARVAASVDLEGLGRLWDIQTGQERADFRLPPGFPTVSFGQGGRTLISRTQRPQETIDLCWEAAPEIERRCLYHLGVIHHVLMAPDGRTVVSISQPATTRIWDAASGLERGLGPDSATAIVGLCNLPDGRTLLEVNGEGSLLTCSLSDGAETSAPRPLRKNAGLQVKAAAFTVDGQTLALAARAEDAGRTVVLFDTESGQERGRLTGRVGVVRTLAFAPDGRSLAVVREQGTIEIWDVSERKERLSLAGRNGQVEGLRFAPDGKLLAVAGSDGRVTLWDAGTGKQTAVLAEHDGPVHCLAFSPDGTRLATGGEDQTLRLWDVATGKETAVLRGHRGGVYSVAFTPDGKRLYTGSCDQTLRWWDVPAGH